MRAVSTLIISLLAISCCAWSYSAARKNREGNEFYKKGQYAEALKSYSEAMTEAPEKPELYFNIGDALYKQSQFPEAVKLYERSAAPGKGQLQSEAFYNVGNAKYRIGKKASNTDSLKEAIAFYEKSLELNPDDMDAKYNLEFVRRELKKLEQQKKEKEQKKEQEKKDQQKKEEEQKEEEKKKEQEQEKKEKKEKEEQEQEKKEKKEKEEQEKEEKQKPKPQPAKPKPAEKDLTKEQAERLLKAFEREQRDPANFIKAQINPSPEEVDKDW